MSSDSKETKSAPAPKSAEAKTASTPAKETPAKETPAKETPAKETAKTESSGTADSAPSNYSRGEGQKPVSAAYRENWNVIFGDKKPKKKKKR
jgi:hypothetical protein